MTIILISFCISSLRRRGPGRRRRRRRFLPLPQRLRRRPSHHSLPRPLSSSSASSSFQVKKIRTMEFTLGLAAFLTTISGVASFILGVAAELQRIPPLAPKQLKKGKIRCTYPDDHSSYLAYGSLALIVLSAIVGSLHKYHSSRGVKVPVDAYAHSPMLKIFFLWAMFMEGLAFYMIFQPLYTIRQLRTQIYNHPIAECPTADSGVVAGGALSSFGASVLWVVVFIFAKNCREDFLRRNDDNSSVGSYGLIDDESDGAW